MHFIFDEATDLWGIKINRVKLKNILSPKEIQDSMERQMKAERERREKRSAVLLPESAKEATILKTEAEKAAAILNAEAERESKIRRAEGEAEAIRKVQEATADSLKLLNAASPTPNVIAIKSLEAFQKAADGKSTKIIIPSEIQSLAGLAASFKELALGEEER